MRPIRPLPSGRVPARPRQRWSLRKKLLVALGAVATTAIVAHGARDAHQRFIQPPPARKGHYRIALPDEPQPDLSMEPVDGYGDDDDVDEATTSVLPPPRLAVDRTRHAFADRPLRTPHFFDPSGQWGKGSAVDLLKQAGYTHGWQTYVD